MKNQLKPQMKFGYTRALRAAVLLAVANAASAQAPLPQPVASKALTATWPVTTAVTAARNALQQPFASASIWNTPIGQNAKYVPANLPAVPGADVWAPMPQIDEEVIVLRATAPLTSVYYSDAGWTGRDRCIKSSSAVVAQVPVPINFVVANSRRNNSAVFLKSDGRTLVHMQPFTKCSSTSTTATALLKFPDVDLYGDGMYGSHGGSGLSAIGGSLRIGELGPKTGAPRHALKVNVYAKQALAACKTKTECFVWPAKGADSYAVGHYGTAGSTAPASLRMGALLAIPVSRNINNLGLETQPGKMLAWTLQNYGAYVVDDTWGPGFAINAENGPDGSFRSQFKADWGFEFEQRVRDSTPWVRDIQRIITALSVVNNNTAASVGGGGIPLQPLALEISPPSPVRAWKSIIVGN